MNGILNLDKPSGITSQQAVSKIKRAFGVKKVGHAGTLDPMATGVLLVCVGEATKSSALLMDMSKEYLATMKFGERTDTFDAEGQVTETVLDKIVTRDEAEEALQQFRGDIMQMPPMYSALKRNGVPLYKLARKGVEVERKARPLTISLLEIESFDFPHMTVRVRCSKGTYIRSLIDDLGKALGTVAHMTALRRTAVGDFSVDKAFGIESLDGLGAEKSSALCPVDEALAHLEELVLEPADYKIARNGGRFDSGGYELCQPQKVFKLKDPEGRMFALGSTDGKLIKVDRILHLNQ